MSGLNGVLSAEKKLSGTLTPLGGLSGKMSIPNTLIFTQVDNKSIIYDFIRGLALKGYDSALPGQMPVKSEEFGLLWVTPATAEEIEIIIKNLKVSDLSDGDEYATIQYVDQHSGAITSISVNGIQQIIDEHKNVNIAVPVYTAGNGITISENNVIALDDLILDCGTSTINV